MRLLKFIGHVFRTQRRLSASSQFLPLRASSHLFPVSQMLCLCSWSPNAIPGFWLMGIITCTILWDFIYARMRTWCVNICPFRQFLTELSVELVTTTHSLSVIACLTSLYSRATMSRLAERTSRLSLELRNKPTTLDSLYCSCHMILTSSSR